MNLLREYLHRESPFKIILHENSALISLRRENVNEIEKSRETQDQIQNIINLAPLVYIYTYSAWNFLSAK